MSQTHDIKCWPEQFSAIASGEKKFEYRKNDRDYQVGDTLLIREWNLADHDYTGASLTRVIGHMLSEGFGLPKGYAVLGFFQSNPPTDHVDWQARCHETELQLEKAEDEGNRLSNMLGAAERRIAELEGTPPRSQSVVTPGYRLSHWKNGSDELEAALDAFWNAAYTQGQQKRGHDDKQGSAQAAEDDLRQIIAKLAAPAKQMVVAKTPEELAQVLDIPVSTFSDPELAAKLAPARHVVGGDE